MLKKSIRPDHGQQGKKIQLGKSEKICGNGNQKAFKEKRVNRLGRKEENERKSRK